MKPTNHSIFINHSFEHQIPTGPKVTIETQCIIYKNKDDGYVADIEVSETSEIEVMGIKLSERPKVKGERLDSKGDPREITAIQAYENQMDKMGVDIVDMAVKEYERQLIKMSVNEICKPFGITLEGGDCKLQLAAY